MKKFKLMALVAVLVLSFAACSSESTEEITEAIENVTSTDTQAAGRGEKSDADQGERPEMAEDGEGGPAGRGGQEGGPAGRGGQDMPEFDGEIEIPESVSDELREMIEALPEQMQFMIVSQMPEELTEEDEAELMAMVEAMANGEMPMGREGKEGFGSESGSHHDQGPSEAYTSTDRIELDESKSYADGTYTGTATGYKSGLTVTVTIEDNAITEIAITDHNETPGFYEEAFETVPSDIIDEQSTDVDTVSGATRSSEGIILAVEDALSQAEITE